MPLKISLASVTPRRTRPKSQPSDLLVSEFLERASHYTLCETQTYDTEAALLVALDKSRSRAPTQAILLDSTGQLLTSEDFAARLGRLRDDGLQHLVLAIGPADGWSPAARQRGHLLFSLGRITLPHELARVVLAEQLYRALTILAGHPYHSGH